MTLSQRPWWKRKRWIVAGVVWLVVAYPVSLWPAVYAIERGWVSATQLKAAYAPVIYSANALTPQPTIYTAPPDKWGRRTIRVMPDPDPPPWAVSVIVEGYMNTAEWFAEMGRRHAASN